MDKDTYFYTGKLFVDYIKQEQKALKLNHNVKLSTADVSNLLVQKVIMPNRIKLSDTIMSIDINRKWKKLKLRI